MTNFSSSSIAWSSGAGLLGLLGLLGRGGTNSYHSSNSRRLVVGVSVRPS